ncbi:major capsid protein [uncultured Roseibium sp.]|uniref:major capsid protein n=1 Tax=uncultured Roseibium sp. TaxID=1936171 RepID=UPI002622D3D4|nr:major capsid protein [uncultured Roseibium sp.]
MPDTKIADIIEPEVFNPYVIERSAQLSELFRSGIIVPDGELDKLAFAGGSLINMPFFKDLTGNDEVLADNTSLTVNEITTGQDVAVLHARGKAWGVNDLAKALSGDDPMAAIGDLVAEYWARRWQALVISTLTGVFADNVANDASDLVHDVHNADVTTNGAVTLNSNIVTDAKFKLGDAASKLTAIAMHSTVYATLEKDKVIDYVTVDAAGNVVASGAHGNAAEGTTTVARYMGLNVIVDDTMPVAAAATSGFVYTSYIFAEGAIGFGQGGAPVPTETDRDSLAGTDILINRNHFIMHPRGIRYMSAAQAGSFPTNAELATAANWDRVYEKKNVRLVQILTNG